MTLSTGTQIGSYQVVGPLGKGGMGEVYRARDTRLGRDVAIKALPEAVATDPERTARFQREAKVLASLNHPHIAAIYGLEESTSGTFLILELVEGGSLADRLSAGPMTVDEAVGVAKQILDALEAAHEKGIVHRDLKPANIMLTTDGRAKVLDFGLARVVDESAGQDVSNSPTMTATQAGLILGTAAYMSPEQARGRAADRRSDVWAFGCVFYEMLTGKRLFDGEDVSETLAFVLTKTPDVAALPASVPPRVGTVLKRCLERDRKARIPDVSSVRFLLDEALSRPTEVPSRARGRSTGQFLRWLGIAAAVVLAAAAAWVFKSVPAASNQPVGRFEIAIPAGSQFVSLTRHPLAISPDGSKIVYSLSSGLAVRAVSEFSTRVLAGSEGLGALQEPVFSPDGESLAFYAPNDRTIKRISVSGGTPSTICKIAASPYGLTWDATGLLVAQNTPDARLQNGILRCAPDGGQPVVLFAIDGQVGFDGPQVLPGGDAVLYSEASLVPNAWDTARIVVRSLKSGQKKTLIEGGSDARYLASGHLIYAVRGLLMAVSFDPRTLTVGSAPVAVLEGVRRSQGASTGAAHYSVSANGTLVYLSGPVTGVAESDLALADKQGNVTLLKLQPAAYEYPRVSPDGTRIAFTTQSGKENVIWVYDLAGATVPRRLTFGSNNHFPIWSADGKRITFQSDREGDRAIFWQAADGTGVAERLTRPEPGHSHIPDAWSPSGERLAFDVSRGNGQPMLLQMLSMPDKRVTAFDLLDKYSQVPTGATFSPDGRWLAYSLGGAIGNTAGPDAQLGLFVQPVPPTGARFQVSTNGGQEHHPAWSRDGKALYFVGLPGTLWAVGVTTQPALAFGQPEARPRTFPVAAPTTPRTFDLLPDGRTIGASTGSATVSSTSDHVSVVLNWFEELKAKAK